jgi:hypothetical protein
MTEQERGFGGMDACFPPRLDFRANQHKAAREDYAIPDAFQFT